jgi:hypothetical protein
LTKTSFSAGDSVGLEVSNGFRPIAQRPSTLPICSSRPLLTKLLSPSPSNWGRSGGGRPAKNESRCSATYLAFDRVTLHTDVHDVSRCDDGMVLTGQLVYTSLKNHQYLGALSRPNEGDRSARIPAMSQYELCLADEELTISPGFTFGALVMV